MFRRAWKPLTTITIMGTSGYIYYQYRVKPETFEFPVKVKGPDGKTEMASRRVPLLSMKVLESRLHQNASFNTQSRPGGIVWKHATASLASNDPIEDANASEIVQRDPSDQAGPGDFLFFAVMDGHGGFETSQLLSKIIIKAVAAKLFNLNADPSASVKAGWFDAFKSIIRSPSQPASVLPDSDPQQVSLAIQEAFIELDNELLNAPLRVLANSLDEESKKKKLIPDLSKHALSLRTMLPAISGACALMAVFDTAHRNLYVACTGDSRAVAGVWENTEDGQGQWRVEALSDDQTGRNPSELARVQSEHPKEEENDVIRQGRILGGLEPSRAFGDARYKWPRVIQETLNQAFLVGNGTPMRPAPSLFKTPPYVTACPVVTHHKLSLPPNYTSDKAIRFVVLATDGLWDELSNDDVVSLVGGYFAGLKGNIPKSKLPTIIPTSSGSSGIEGKSNKKSNKSEGSWAFADDNVSAHLIRNAFGGGDEATLRRRLSIPAPYSRRNRDDVTVTVVWWEEGNEYAAQTSTEKAKSKL